MRAADLDKYCIQQNDVYSSDNCCLEIVCNYIFKFSYFSDFEDMTECTLFTSHGCFTRNYLHAFESVISRYMFIFLAEFIIVDLNQLVNTFT